ncbi:MAG: hypothetical protein IRZ14_18375, partial [Chloroflexi bacterium]|nr:hypothetical protein [Chloroflexota bacterium]
MANTRGPARRSGRALGAALALLAALLLVAPSAPPPVDASATTPSVAEPASWETVLAQTAALRGLAPRAEIPRTLLSREALQARVQEQLSREPAPERLASTAKLLAALGLLEQG